MKQTTKQTVAQTGREETYAYVNHCLSELTNQIYDTLMQNVGMSECHTGFPIEDLRFQYVDDNMDRIYLEFANKAFEIRIFETAKEV
jgi:hypothetical protein